ncbi:hypothetical protein [Xylella fastidiosa]|uniref:Uncharacterized protein n=1 Tax=Xylella fastidiosa subsp. fastidiosa TaxID=644356 RepID=A0AAJ5QY28_XYLFS|nr:hypothetical protein [Xylella fastidiosa]WCF27271.1 hypothetical protein OK117_06250 [Xylella fastidiosa subsp. fastidiosa]
MTDLISAVSPVYQSSQRIAASAPEAPSNSGSFTIPFYYQASCR